MSDAAMILQVLHRPDETDHEIEVGRSAGEKTGGDAPRQRTRRRVLRRGGPGEERPRQRVCEGVQLDQSSRNHVSASCTLGKFRTLTPRFIATTLMKSLALRASSVRCTSAMRCLWLKPIVGSRVMSWCWLTGDSG